MKKSAICPDLCFRLKLDVFIGYQNIVQMLYRKPTGSSLMLCLLAVARYIQKGENTLSNGSYSNKIFDFLLPMQKRFFGMLLLYSALTLKRHLMLDRSLKRCRDRDSGLHDNDDGSQSFSRSPKLRKGTE